MTKTFDPKCHHLASVFLVDHPEKLTESNIDKLAAHIQEQIEDWIEYQADGPAPSKGDPPDLKVCPVCARRTEAPCSYATAPACALSNGERS